MAQHDTIRFPDKYCNLKHIGSGGTADVYLAQRDGMALPLALKVFREGAAELCAGELTAAARLHFPGVVRVFGKGLTACGRTFLELEYCPGPTMDKFAGKLNERQWLGVMSALSIALTVLDKQKIIHNDLKPSNIYCPPEFEIETAASGHPFLLKLADFSLAYFATENNAGKITGTVGYMSPEMINRGNITAHSDIFSLGVIGYFLACGRMPFGSKEDDPLKVNAAASEGKRPELTGPGAVFNPQINDLIKKMLTIDPARRPQSAFTLTEELSRIGSKYPFRKMIAPRHLLARGRNVDADCLDEAFGPGAFSEAQHESISKITGGDYHNLRLLLDHNFKIGNFSRLDRKWGWKNETPDAIEIPGLLCRFAVRPLRAKSLSLKKLALATAVADNAFAINEVADALNIADNTLLEAWHTIPATRTAALIFALDKRLSGRVRRVLALKLAPRFESNIAHSAAVGKLYYHGEEHQKAIEYLIRAVEKTKDGENVDYGFRLLELALSAAKKLDDCGQQSEILLKRAVREKEMGRYEDSENSYYRVIELLQDRGRDELIAQTYKALGDLYKATSQYQKGITALTRALELYRHSGERLGLSHSLNNLGNMYWVAGKFDLALKNYHEALEIQRELDSQKDIASSLNNIGTIHAMQGEYKKAVDFYQESLAIKEKLNDKIEIARTFNNLGGTYFYMGDNSRAIESFNKSLNINREIGSRVEELLNLENLAEIMIQTGRLNVALKHLRDGTELAAELGDLPRGCTFARLTGQLLRRMGNYDEAENQLLAAQKTAGELSSQPLLLPCQINLARLYHALRDGKKTDEYMTRAVAAAKELGETNALFHLALLQFRVSGQAKFLKIANELLERLDTPRERALMNLAGMEHCIESGEITRAGSFVEKAAAYFEGEIDDIDSAAYYLVAGLYKRMKSDLEDAVQNLNNAMELALKKQLLPEQWQTGCALSELMFEMKDFESAYRHARETIEKLKRMTSSMADGERVQRIYNDPQITALLGRIKSLQAVLTK